MDHQIDGDARLMADAPPFFGFMRADAGQLVFDVRLYLGDQAGQQVHLVGRGGGDEHFGVLNACLPEDPNAGGVAVHHAGVQRAVQKLIPLLIGLDQGDFVAFADESLRDQVPYFTAACNQYSHPSLSRS